MTGAELLPLDERAGTLRLPVRVRPRASRDAVLGVREGELDLAVTAPPVDRAANLAVLELLARVFHVRPKDVSIVLGARHRSKVAEIRRLSAVAARARLDEALRR